MCGSKEKLCYTALMHTPPRPSADVLKAFGINDEPILLKGGQGSTWRAGDVVLKPTNSEEKSSWCAELIESLPQDQYRVARHKKAHTNAWVYEGWEVIEFIKGAHLQDHWKEKIAVCNGFNGLLTSIPKPYFIDKRTDLWAIAEKMIWEELPLSFDERLYGYVQKIKAYLKPITIANQLIHGDITGNMLFAEGLPQGIIDFTPIYRPKEYALAILIVDAITWEGADASIFSYVKNEANMFQLLLRAAFFRTLTMSEFYRLLRIDRFSELPKHESIVEILIQNQSQFT